jgi:hypothetical protein
MRRADLFVYYDDVQFDKHGWRNRNRIKSPNGPTWLTVPVRHKGLNRPKILDIEIDNRQPWARKQLRTIAQLYANAPFLNNYLPELEEIISYPWTLLVDLDLAVTAAIIRWLGVECAIHRSSELNIGGERNERLINICNHFKADHYLSGDSAKSYLDLHLFQKNRITVEWQQYKHPIYSQLHGEFIPFLSAIDLLFNLGPEGERVLREENSRS